MANLKFCVQCKSEIHEMAEVCPSCKTKQVQDFKNEIITGCIAGIIFSIIVLIIVSTPQFAQSMYQSCVIGG